MEFSTTAGEERSRQWYPTIFPRLSSTRSWGQQSEQGHPDFNLHGNFFIVLGPTQGLLLRELSRAHPIQKPDPPQLAPLDVEQWLSQAAQMAEFLTLSLREHPTTIQRKLMLAACMWYLVLSAMIQSP